MTNDVDARGPGADDGRAFAVALSLMRMALALLDRAGEPLAATHLQHAIDTAERRGPGAPTPDELQRFLDQQLD